MSSHSTNRSQGWRIVLLLGIYGVALAYAFLGSTGDKAIEIAAITALAVYALAQELRGQLPLALQLGTPVGLLILVGIRAPEWISMSQWQQMVDGFWVISVIGIYWGSFLISIFRKSRK